MKEVLAPDLTLSIEEGPSLDHFLDNQDPINIQLVLENSESFQISFASLGFWDTFRLKRRLLKEYSNKDWFFVKENNQSMEFFFGTLSSFQKKSLLYLKNNSVPVQSILRSEDKEPLHIREKVSPLLFLKWFLFLKQGVFILSGALAVFLLTLLPALYSSLHTIERLQEKTEQMNLLSKKLILPVELQKKTDFFRFQYNRRLAFDEGAENPLPVLEQFSTFLINYGVAKRVFSGRENGHFLIRVEMTEDLDEQVRSQIREQFQESWDLLETDFSKVELRKIKRDKKP